MNAAIVGASLRFATNTPGAPIRPVMPTGCCSCAADCATAEVYATASMMMEAPAAVALLDSVGLAGLVVGSDGGVHRTSTLAEFIA